MKKYKKGRKISPSLASFLERMKKYEYSFFTEIIVDTKRKKMSLFSGEISCSIPCEIGKNGFVLYSESKSGDGKTPICSTKVRHIDMPITGINDPNSAVFSKTLNSKVNFGPCFVMLYITLPGVNDIRGIGLHGSHDDTDGLEPTDGCIRLYNADLYAIRKLFFKNLKVKII